MANIPVERKSGTPWWTWLLALIAIAGVIWLVAELIDEEPDADDIAGLDDDVGLIDDAELGVDETAPVVITTAAFYDMPDRESYVGQRVELDSLRVERVLGDSTFTVSAIDGRLDVPNLAVLSEEPSPDVPGVEGQVDINPGQIINLSGTVMRLDSDPANVLGITQEEADTSSVGQIYIRVAAVDITESDLNQRVEVE